MQKQMYSVHRLRRSQSKHRLWKKKNSERHVSHADCISLEHGKGLDRKGKKRKTHSSLHMGRLSYGELPTRAVQRGLVSPTVQRTSMQASLSLSLSPQAYMFWLRASLRAEKQREERAWQTSKPAETGWTTVLIMELQSQRCNLCASWES